MPSRAGSTGSSRALSILTITEQRLYEVNKGMAIAGNTLFWATAVDCHLLAIDIKTGRVIWDITDADWKKGYQFNVPPLVVKTW